MMFSNIINYYRTKYIVYYKNPINFPITRVN